MKLVAVAKRVVAVSTPGCGGGERVRLAVGGGGFGWLLELDSKRGVPLEIPKDGTRVVQLCRTFSQDYDHYDFAPQGNSRSSMPVLKLSAMHRTTFLSRISISSSFLNY
ncbi:hypothetical protein PsorP6_012444 [Peronosclerospora sorghi]|uniref:Uncharacterized protein n=1 Tax=Peronosclerospora sorghi TaxID=230839 RepID=A0ACC0WJD8_9STRA|nr:hypothetical protein PsorP6_012444 [Peronosclerospora sorghi]